MCIMCLMQILGNYEIPLCNQCHSTSIVSNMLLTWLQQQFIVEHMTWWLMKIGLDRGLLKLKK
jgi:hypothetical protein